MRPSSVRLSPLPSDSVRRITQAALSGNEGQWDEFSELVRLRDAHVALGHALGAIKSEHAQAIRKLKHECAETVKDIQTRCDEKLAASRNKHAEELNRLKQMHAQDMKAVKENHATRVKLLEESCALVKDELQHARASGATALETERLLAAQALERERALATTTLEHMRAAFVSELDRREALSTSQQHVVDGEYAALCERYCVLVGNSASYRALNFQYANDLTVLRATHAAQDARLRTHEQLWEKLLAELGCAITFVFPKVPAVTVTGGLYEKDAIQKWLGTSQTCPLTRAPLSEDGIIYPASLRDAFEIIREGATLSGFGADV
jgi:gas vesicle protein